MFSVNSCKDFRLILLPWRVSADGVSVLSELGLLSFPSRRRALPQSVRKVPMVLCLKETFDCRAYEDFVMALTCSEPITTRVLSLDFAGETWDGCK